MATSPIYNWPEPDNTDLVKNGALAMRTLGDAIDTTMATMVPKSIVDAKGDLIAATAADTPARLAVGTNGQVLTADSTAATGIKWATASSPSYSWTTFTPSWYGLTLGNGTVNFAQYLQIDKIVFVRLRTTLGSTSSVASQIAFNAPVTGADDNSVYNGISYINDSSPGATFLGTTQYYGGVIYPAYYSVVSATIQSPNTGATAPMTWANTDWFQLFTWYKAA